MFEKIKKWGGEMYITRGFLVAFILAGITLSMTLIGTYFVQNTVEHDIKKEFDQRVFSVENQIRDRFELYTNALYSTQGFFAASDFVSRTEFDTYIENLRIPDRYPGIASLVLVSYLKSDERQSFLPHLESQNQKLSIYPETNNKELFVVTHGKTFDDQEIPFGFDLGTDPSYAAIFKQSQQQAQPLLTERINLHPSGEPGFLFVMPIYRPGNELAGFVVSSLSVQSFFGNFLTGPVEGKSVDFEIFDQEVFSREHLIYDSDDMLRAIDVNYKPRLSTTRFVTLGGRRWTLYFAPPRDTAFTLLQNWSSSFVLVGGILFSLLLFILMYSLVNSRYKATDLAEHIKRELHDQMRKLDEILLASPDHIYLHDVEGRYVYANPAGSKMFGISPQDFTGKTWQELGLPKQAMEHYERDLKYVGQTGRVLKGELEISFDESKHYFEYILSPIHNAEGVIENVLASMRDITDRTHTQSQLKERTGELERLNRMMVGRELKMVELKKKIDRCDLPTNKKE